MKKMKKRIISLMMAFIMVFSLFVGTGNLSASDDSKGESGADKDTLLGATPTDADPVADENEDTEEETTEEETTEEETTTEETEDSIIGTVTFYKETPSAATENNNMAGIQYGIYKDADCSDLVDTIVLSYDGHIYREGANDKVYNNREERGFGDGEISNHELQLELPVSTYYYKEKNILKNSSLDFSTTGYVYSSKIGSFDLTADNSPLTVKIKDEWNIVKNQNEKADSEIATSSDAKENTEDTSRDSTTEDIVTTTEDFSNTEEESESTTADITDEVTEDTSSEEATEEQNEKLFNIATPDIATPSELEDGMIFVGPISFTIKSMFAPLLASVNSTYYVRRNQKSNYAPKFYLYTEGSDRKENDLYSVYCGDRNLGEPWFYEYGNEQSAEYGTPVSLKTYGSSSGSPLSGLNSNIAKVLYYGYLNGYSRDAIQKTLNSYRNSESDYQVDISGKSDPVDAYKAEIKLGTVSLKNGTVNNISAGTKKTNNIAPTGTEKRYMYSYTLTKNLVAKGAGKNIYTLESEFYSGAGHKLNGLDSGKSYKRSNIYKVVSSGNSYTIKVPKNVICYTTTGHAEKGINSCSWNKYDEGRNVTLSNGTYFMFVANGSYQGTSSIDASAENYGFVAHMASPDDTSIQTLFGAELYQYSISFDIDWEMESGSANLEIIKKATDGSTYKDWDLDSYNMAGITYVIYDKSNNRVTSDAYTRGDKISVTRADQIVLSYDGVAYMNENGDNIVFVTPQSKKNYSGDLYHYRWYKNITSKTTYYYKEAARPYGGSGKAKYINDSKEAKAIIDSLKSSKDLSVTGFKQDKANHSFTLDLSSDATKEVIENPKDEREPFWGKFGLTKVSKYENITKNNSNYNMAGIKYGIYKTNKSDNSTNLVSSDAHTRKDGITVVSSKRIVLSYNGEAYMDNSGKNVVFVNAAAYSEYCKANGTPDKFKWYKHGLYNDATYYYKETATLLKTGETNAYYYNPGSRYSTIINNIQGKNIEWSGYKLDTGFHKFTISQGSNETMDVEGDPTDDVVRGKGKATKKNNSGAASELKGIKFYLYAVPDNKTVPNNSNKYKDGSLSNGELIGIYEHDGTKVVAKNVVSTAESYNIVKSGEYFTNLPCGWYCLVEDKETATSLGFNPSSTPVYEKIDPDHLTISFDLVNSRTGLKLHKYLGNDSDMNKLCSYSVAGAEYKAYIVKQKNSMDTSNYIATFTTVKGSVGDETVGKGYISDYAKNKGYTLAGTKNGKSYTLRGIPLNTWVYITETKTSEGCGKAADQWVYFDNDNMDITVRSDEPLRSDPISLSIKKEDSTSKKKAGAASLAGAEFTVKYYDVDVSGSNLDKNAVYKQIKGMKPERTWVFKTDENGEVKMRNSETYFVAQKSNKLYLDGNGNPKIPYGAITIQETKAPEGYTTTGAFTTTDGKDKSNEDGVIFAIINENYSTEKFIGTNALIKKEEVLRADIKFKKIALDTNKPLSGIAFKITSKTTGESHVVVTDKDGMIDTSKIKHSNNTNAADSDNKTVCGTWFYGNDEEEKTIDDSLGSLPFDTYEITEVATDTNVKYRLITPIIVDLTNEKMYADGYQLYDLGTVTNVPEPWIGTRALGVKTQDNIIPANEKVDVEDITNYYYLEAGKTFTVKGIIMDPATKKPYVQPDGTYSMGHKTFTVSAADDSGYTCADVNIPFVIDTTGLDGKDVVVAEYVYEGEDNTDLTVNEDGSIDETGVYKTHTGKLVKHDDLTAKTQTLSIPKIGTTALGVETETHYLHASGIQKFKDIVNYENVLPGKTYDLLAVVMDKSNGKPLLDVDGKKVTATASYTPKEKNGSAEVIFTCDVSKVDFRDKAIVLFEDLYYNKIHLTAHADITDEGQTLYFPDVTSVLIDTKTGSHKALYSKQMSFNDELNLTKLPVNEELTIKDVLMNTRTRKPVQMDGKEITAEKKQTFESSTATVKLPFAFDGTKTDLMAEDGTLADIVAFVYVYDSKGNLIASEENLLNRDQTITLFTDKTNISVKKVWKDCDDSDGIRPDDITVQLYKNRTEKISLPVILNEDNDWSYTWNALEKQENGEDIEYSVDEVQVPNGYKKVVTNDGTAFTITNTHKPDKTKVSVKKVWNDADNADEIRPESIKVQLYKNGNTKVYDAVELSEKNNWSYTWEELPTMENNEDIIYTVDEVEIPAGYEKEVTNKETKFIITNTHIPDVTKISVNKVWDDNDDQDSIRPETVKVQLYRDGVDPVGNPILLSENNNWTYTWESLPKMDDGKLISYTVDEIEIPDGYSKSVTKDGTKFIIKNIHKPGTTLVKVTKVWADNNDKYQTRPKTIEVQLYKGEGEDKEKVGDPVILDSEMNWKYTWSNLEKTENGKDITYSVDEVSVPSGYRKSVTKDDGTEVISYTITNSKNPGPKTGDAFKMIPVILLMGVSLIAIIILIIMRRKKR